MAPGLLISGIGVSRPCFVGGLRGFSLLRGALLGDLNGILIWRTTHMVSKMCLHARPVGDAKFQAARRTYN